MEFPYCYSKLEQLEMFILYIMYIKDTEIYNIYIDNAYRRDTVQLCGKLLKIIEKKVLQKK